jgi:hypothetical protein
MIVVACLGLVVLAACGVVCTLRAVATDGYRRIPTR